MTHDYKRHGTTTLFAALDILEGKVIGRCMQRHRHQEFIRILNAIEAHVPARKIVHVILVDAALAHWVEDGVAPDQIIATRYRDNDPTKGIEAQRPGVPIRRPLATRAKATERSHQFCLHGAAPVRLAGSASAPLAGWGQAPVCPAGPPPVATLPDCPAGFSGASWLTLEGLLRNARTWVFVGYSLPEGRLRIQTYAEAC
jgi:hypothetical protein